MTSRGYCSTQAVALHDAAAASYLKARIALPGVSGILEVRIVRQLARGLHPPAGGRWLPALAATAVADTGRSA